MVILLWSDCKRRDAKGQDSLAGADMVRQDHKHTLTHSHSNSQGSCMAWFRLSLADKVSSANEQLHFKKRLMTASTHQIQRSNSSAFQWATHKKTATTTTATLSNYNRNPAWTGLNENWWNTIMLLWFYQLADLFPHVGSSWRRLNTPPTPQWMSRLFSGWQHNCSRRGDSPLPNAFTRTATPADVLVELHTHTEHYEIQLNGKGWSWLSVTWAGNNWSEGWDSHSETCIMLTGFVSTVPIIHYANQAATRLGLMSETPEIIKALMFTFHSNCFKEVRCLKCKCTSPSYWFLLWKFPAKLVKTAGL